MLIIRKAQKKALTQKEDRKFESQMLDHLRKFFPDQSLKMDEQALRETVRYGSRRSEHYGCNSVSEKTKYLNLMFVFGRDFDVDPDLKWAAKFFRPRKGADRRININHLYEVAVAYESEGRGLQHELEAKLHGGK